MFELEKDFFFCIGDVLTTLLVVVAVVGSVAAAIARCHEMRFFARQLAGFRVQYGSLSPFGKILAAVALCLCTLIGGSKDGVLSLGMRSSPLSAVLRDGQGTFAGGTGGACEDECCPVSYEAFSNLQVTAISVAPTNLSLTASWQALTNSTETFDVYSSTNLLQRRWQRQASVTVSVSDTNAVFDLPLDWFGTPSSLFLRLGSRYDSDGDGLPDALERLAYGTNPALADSDADGLADAEELQIGTDPLSADTDGDGIDDADEREGSSFIVREGTLSLDSSEKTNLIAGLDFCDDECFSLSLPFPVTLFGYTATNMVIDSNGLVYLTPRSSFSPSSRYRNEALPADFSAEAVCVAPFWDDLRSRSDSEMSELNVFCVETNGVDYFVVEFKGFSFYSENSSGNKISFRMAMADEYPNRVWICYDEAYGRGCGSSATIGACKCFAPFEALNVDALLGNVTAGTMLELRLSDSTDPLCADTDGDGLSDGEERMRWTSPTLSDTDGDGLSDGWEVQYGFSPTASNASDLSADSDGDGLSAWEECQYNTSPFSSSTYGVPDADYVDNGCRPFPPEDYVEVPISIGDPSGSESERWAIHLTELGNSHREYKVATDGYGTMRTRCLRLAHGSKYRMAVRHIASSDRTPDYDWEAQIGDMPECCVLESGQSHPDSRRWFSLPSLGVVVDNQSGLLGTCDESFGNENNAEGKVAYLYVVKADLVGYAALRGSEEREIPEDERFDPGYLVMGTGTDDTDAMPAKVKFAKLESGFALSRYMRFSEAGRIKAKGSYDWAVAGTTDEIAIPGNVDVDAYRKLAINSIADWPAGTTHIDVEYIVRDRDGELLTASTNRLLRPYLIACGNSLTWGLRRYNHALETPQWNAPWTTYPGEAEWQAEGLPPANRFLKAYQGYRGYLAEKLPGVTWLGLDTNGHGPPHLGFPGAKASQIYKKMGDHASLFTKENCYQVVVYCAGMNDCTGSATAEAIANDWRLGVATNDFMRTDKGRTLFVALKVPEVTSVYFEYSHKDHQAVNQKISSVNVNMGFVSANPFFKFVLGDTAQILHENDDGMHFSDVGYGIMADRVYSAIMEGLSGD